MNQIRRLCERVFWIDGGQIRQQGPTAEVSAAYEAAGAGQQESRDRTDALNVKASFQSWEILDPRGARSNVLDSFGPLAARVTLAVRRPLRNVQHGIVLYNSERQLLWGAGFDGLQLEKGVQHFLYKLPTLPLRPGAYNFRVTLYDDHGLIDDWECFPDLVVATQPVTHPKDEWAGFLNIPCSFSIARADLTTKGESLANETAGATGG